MSFGFTAEISLLAIEFFGGHDGGACDSYCTKAFYCFLFLVWEFWKYLLKALHCDAVIVAREAETSQINISSELPTCQQHVNTEYIKWMMGIFWLHAHSCCWLIPTLKSVTVLLLRFGFCFDFILVFLCSLWFTSRYLVIMCFCPPFSRVFVNLCQCWLRFASCVLFLFYSPHHIHWPP